MGVNFCCDIKFIGHGSKLVGAIMARSCPALSSQGEGIENDQDNMSRTPLFLLLCALATVIYVSDASSSPSTKLFHLQCRRKHAHPSKHKPPSSGSLIRFQRPTPERVARWFHRNGANFNHDDVGMTNPCLHIDLMDEASTDSVVEVSTTSTNESSDWWPAACPSSKGWRSLKLYRRVGRGLSCYNAVRDAVLEWEFDGDQACGIVQVHSPQQHSHQLYQRRDSYGTGYDIVHNMCFGDGDLYENSEGAIQIWSGPGGRRLATFTQAFRSKWLPRIYCVNPVTVIYDLVDQRGPGTTYTSTAYATCKGHWLRGEERLTVAHRDGGNVDVEIVSYSKHGNSLWGRMIWPCIGPLQGRFFDSQMRALENVAAQHSGGRRQ